LKEIFKDFDAEKIFEVGHLEQNESILCIAGEVLKGVKKPVECSAFGKECKPETPLGAPMVSTEGACAAYFHYGKNINNSPYAGRNDLPRRLKDTKVSQRKT
jgi:hydrogenase expression/formation protein HypD